MKIQITMKSPDAIDHALEDVDVEPDVLDDLRDKLHDWFKWGEYVDLEYDTETDTMIVKRTS